LSMKLADWPSRNRTGGKGIMISKTMAGMVRGARTKWVGY
jgi:hypothetical protein